MRSSGILSPIVSVCPGLSHIEVARGHDTNTTEIVVIASQMPSLLLEEKHRFHMLTFLYDQLSLVCGKMDGVMMTVNILGIWSRFGAFSRLGRLGSTDFNANENIQS